MSFSNLFKKGAVGLDIADRSIEVAELRLRGGRAVIGALGREELPRGVVERGRIKDAVKLAEAVRGVLGLARPAPISARRVVFGLPETQVYLHTFVKAPNELPAKLGRGGKAAAEEWQNFLRREAAENVPLADDFHLIHEIIEERPDRVSVLLVVLSHAFLREWQEFFQTLGLAVEFDLETRALYRSIRPPLPGGADRETVALVDFGALATNIAVFEHGGLRYSRTLPYGTEELIAGLAKNLKLTDEAAEQAAREVGLVDPDNKIFTVLLNALAPLRDELKVTLDYYERWSGRKVEKLFMAGGGSQLRGLADYFQSNLELPTAVARSAFLNQSLVYLEATGLALRGLFGPRQPLDEALTDNWRLSERTKPPSAWRRPLTILIVVGLLVWLAWAYVWPNLAEWWPRSAGEKVDQVAPSPEVIFGDLATSTEDVAPAPLDPLPPAEEITIATTPTDWLNVRSGPGTSFDIMTRVYPGENYPLLEEEGDWYKIELEAEDNEEIIEGWVSGQYVIRN